MPRPPELKEYIEAFGSSSTRARYVLLVAIVASILVFAAFWNSRQGSWINERLHMLRIASVACPSSWSDSVKNRIPQDDQEIFDRSKSFTEFRHLHSCEQMGEVERDLERIQTQSVNLNQVPFFGVVVDVNDLGILGGLTFSIALLWFRFSLARELDNLQLAIDAGRADGQLLACYRLLEMNQVLTVPPTQQSGKSRFWRRLPLVLFVLPLAMSLVVFIHDAMTLKFGWSISHFNTAALFVAGLTFLIVVLILTIQCVTTTLEMGRIWQDTARELNLIK